MKQCSKCKQQKTLDSFAKRGDNYHSWCRLCKRAYDRYAYKNNVGQGVCRRKDKVKERRDRQNTKSRRFIHEYLLKHPCKDCGETDPIVLEFDHLKDKVQNIANMLGYSIEALQKEIQKCEVVCANCHRRRTAQRGNWYKGIASIAQLDRAGDS